MARHGPPRKRTLPPLDPRTLEAIALRYVERFQTTRARLVRYLSRKVRERGWDEESPPDLEAIATNFVTRGYIDEGAFAEARSRGMKARGLGARRIHERLRADGVSPPDVVDEEEALALALAFARRRRLGPFGPPSSDPRVRQRQMAAMLRAGHSIEVSRKVLSQDVAVTYAKSERTDPERDEHTEW